MKRRILFSLLIITIIGLIVIGNIAGRLIIQIRDNSQINKDNTHLPLVEGFRTGILYYTSKDGLKLSGLLVKTDSIVSKGTVILVHGIRSGKEHYIPASKLLAKNGYNSVLVDLRAHGQSEGKYCTFGFYEKQDMAVLIDSLLKRNDISHHFGIWGNSLGAAVALQTMSIDKRIKFGIIESTFADFRTVVHEYSSGTVGFNFPVLNDYAIWWAEIIGDFNGSEVVPSEAVKHIQRPIIMVHGTDDNNINIKYGKKNFENLASKDKTFIEIPKADHNDVWRIGGEEYFKQIIDFVDRVSENEVALQDMEL